MSGNWTPSPPQGNTTVTALPHLSTPSQAVISVFYAVGIVANVAALGILCSGKKYRNRKHTLMLRFLAGNDLVALVGMLVQMYLQLHGGEFATGRALCVFRVVWRFFGISSGCVAIVMAVERWLALTHPFIYQKHVTPAVIKRGIFALWLMALVLVCLPFVGFGIYYSSQERKCLRYKEATAPVHRAYALLFCSVGMLMVVCLVVCNVSVIRALCRMGCRGRRKGAEVLGRRISRESSRGSRTTVAAVGPPPAAASLPPAPLITYNSSTREELTFARLMALICVVFVVCWLPQMIGILLSQFLPGRPFTQKFGRLADILLSLHYVLNPFIYVLLSCRGQPCLPGVLKVVCRSCRRRGTQSSSAPGSLAMTEHDHLESTDAPSSPMITSSAM